MHDNKKHFIWQPLVLNNQETISVHIGHLELYIAKEDNELFIASSHVAKAVSDYCIQRDLERSADLEWKSWILPDGQSQLQLVPILPDRPVVTRPEMPIYLSPKQSVQFYVEIPVFIQVQLLDRQKVICEIPTTILSNTWYGTPVEGELCYSLHTCLKQDHNKVLPDYHRVISPVQINNKSDDIFEVCRICINVKYQNIYQGLKRMWANGGKVSYLGDNTWSQLTYVKTPPALEECDIILAEARKAADKNIFFRTYDTIKPLHHLNI